MTLIRVLKLVLACKSCINTQCVAHIDMLQAWTKISQGLAGHFDGCVPLFIALPGLPVLSCW